jgi:hypothetical protein
VVVGHTEERGEAVECRRSFASAHSRCSVCCYGDALPYRNQYVGVHARLDRPLDTPDQVRSPGTFRYLFGKQFFSIFGRTFAMNP